MYRFYVSSYAKGKEKGLYVCTLDETKNELHLNKHIPTEDFPSYVIKKDDYLYVSLKDARVGEGGGVASYHIEEDEFQQLDLFDKVDDDKEIKVQKGIIEIKNKFGKMQVLRCSSLQDKATARIRNKLVGGHNGE